MAPQIVPLKKEDISILVPEMYKFSLTIPIYRFMFKNYPDPSATTAYFQRVLEGSFADSQKEDSGVEMWKIIESEGDEEIMRGMLLLKWNFGSNKKNEGNAERGGKKEEEKIPEGMNPEFRRVNVASMVTVQKSMEGIDFLQLSTIFVFKSSQSKGLGTQLVRFTQARAAEAKVPVFRNGIPYIVGWYESLGFKEGKSDEIDLSEWAERIWGVKGGGWGVWRWVGMSWEAPGKREEPAVRALRVEK